MQEEEEFVFSDILERPVPSILRGYSAPVRMDSDLTDTDLSFLLANDSDEFNRYVIFDVKSVYLPIIGRIQNNVSALLVGRLGRC